MFRFLVLIFPFFSLSLFPQNQVVPWKKIANPVDKTLKHISFINEKTGWAAGESGTIIKTTNGGYDWQVQTTNVETFIVDIFFLNENLGWALTVRELAPFGTDILHTTDGGETWIVEPFPQPSLIMNTIFFFDSLNGFIGGRNISKTTDGGETWQVCHVDSNMVSALPVYKFKFFSKEFGYACGGFIDLAGVIWRTTDGGNNWSATPVSADQVFDMYIKDSLNAVCLSGDPEGFFGTANIKTTDAGETWVTDELPFYGLSFAIDFRTNTEAWSASGFQFMFSNDGGNSWITMPSPENSPVYDLKFINENTGIAAGGNGVILKYISSASAVEDVNREINFTLEQNYPNPFNPVTKIKFTIPKTWSSLMRPVQLKIYDILGKEVATLVNEEKPAGEYEIEFDIQSSRDKSLTSGIYFYRLRAGSFVQTKKMILLK